MEIDNQLFVISRIEKLCFDFRCSIIDLNLKSPSPITIFRYFKLLTKITDLEYCANLLYECWELAYPDSFIEHPTSKEISCEDLLKKDYKQQERDDWTVQHMQHYRNMQGSEYKRYCRSCLSDLFRLLEPVFEKHNLILKDNFTFSQKILVNIEVNKLESVYKELVNQNCLLNDDKTKTGFLSLFSNTLLAKKNLPITWLAKTEKSSIRTPVTNIAKLYTLFEVLGANMKAEKNKQIIANSFIGINGEPIEPEDLKNRKDSQTLKKFTKSIKSKL